jgi:hypothetical protein
LIDDSPAVAGATELSWCNPPMMLFIYLIHLKHITTPQLFDPNIDRFERIYHGKIAHIVRFITLAK